MEVAEMPRRKVVLHRPAPPCESPLRPSLGRASSLGGPDRRDETDDVAVAVAVPLQVRPQVLDACLPARDGFDGFAPVLRDAAGIALGQGLAPAGNRRGLHADGSGKAELPALGLEKVAGGIEGVEGVGHVAGASAGFGADIRRHRINPSIANFGDSVIPAQRRPNIPCMRVRIGKPDLAAFGKRLNELLDQKGAPPLARGRGEWAAKRYRASTASAWAWLHGKSIPARERARSMADDLGVSYEYLIFGDLEPISGSPSSLPDEGRLHSPFTSLVLRKESLTVAIQMAAEALVGLKPTPAQHAEYVALLYELIEDGMPEAQVLHFARRGASAFTGGKRSDDDRGDPSA